MKNILQLIPTVILLWVVFVGGVWKPKKATVGPSWAKVELENVEKSESVASNDGEAMQVGDESVVMGAIPKNAKIGDRSTVVGATDSNGNTILNTPMAVGYNAQAGPGGISIGAYAGQNSNPSEIKNK